MNIKRNIKRIFFLVLWIVLATGVSVLLVAAISIKNQKTCKGIDIEIRGVKEFYFLNRQDIIKIISKEGMDEPRGKAVARFDLQKLEALLEENIWVKDAELFFDNNMIFHINISEKEPVARIFSTSGNSYYIDSSGSKLPLSDKMNVRLPVFTGFPSERSRLTRGDSALKEHVKKLSRYILNDDFWMAQIAQVVITPEKNFEMVPTVGNHTIQFGNGENCESKFRRLFIFYTQVLNKAGFDKYNMVSVQYDKQIIGRKKGIIAKIDSVQAVKNIQKMIEEAKRVTVDSIYMQAEANMSALKITDSSLTLIPYRAETDLNRKEMKNNSDAKKQGSIIKKPKAVMGKPDKQE